MTPYLERSIPDNPTIIFILPELIKRLKRAFFCFTSHDLAFERIPLSEGGMPNANYYFQTSLVA